MTDYFVRPNESATGRVPQWAKDEALGKTSQAAPIRVIVGGAWSPTTAPRTSGGHRQLVLLSVVVIAVVAVSYLVGFDNRLGSTHNRAMTRTGGPPQGVGSSAKRLLPAPPAPPAEAEGPRFRFLQQQPGSTKPVTWDACRPIQYVVRPDNAPPGGDVLLAEGFAALSQATGLSFVYEGVTTEGPVEDREIYQRKRYGDRWAPVLVTWATVQEVPDFGTDIAGRAGPVSVTTASGDRAFVSGVVSFDAQALLGYVQQGRPSMALHVILHELGHLTGLGHVSDPAQRMLARGGGDPSSHSYGQGDLAGLAALGSKPCQRDV